MAFRKTIIGACAALVTVGGAFGAVKAMAPDARGVLDSGPLPLASRKELNDQLAALAFQLQAVQKEVAKQSAHADAQDRFTSSLSQDLLEGKLAGARADYAKAPTKSGRDYVCALINQVDVARAANGLPPVPPC